MGFRSSFRTRVPALSGPALFRQKTAFFSVLELLRERSSKNCKDSLTLARLGPDLDRSRRHG